MKRVFLSVAGILFVLASVAVFAVPSARAAPLLNQTSVTVGLGQSVTIPVQGTTGVYMLSNSNSAAVSVSTAINGTQITVMGVGLGGAMASFCFIGTASDCTIMNVTVQSASVSGLTFDQSSPSINIGQTVNVAVSGGSGYYISGNSNSGVAAPSLASSTIIITGAGAGTSAITVCSASNGCGTVNITVGFSTSASTSTSGSQAVGFTSASSPTLSVGQILNVSLSGGTKYFIIANSNASAAQATISESTLTIHGISAGSSILTVCIAGGNCSPFPVTVTAGQTQAQTQTQTQTPAQTQTLQQSSADVATLLAAIQAAQSQLAQILAQITSLSNTLSQLAAKVSVSAQTSSASTSVSFSGTFTQYLALGSEGAEVTVLQNKLKTLGFYSGSITRYFGSLTEAAVKAYQSARGISPLGYVGPSTRAALNAE